MRRDCPLLHPLYILPFNRGFMKPFGPSRSFSNFVFLTDLLQLFIQTIKTNIQYQKTWSYKVRDYASAPPQTPPLAKIGD